MTKTVLIKLQFPFRSADFFVTTAKADQLFDSCVKVKDGQGIKFACGARGDNCNCERLFGEFGSASGMLSR